MAWPRPASSTTCRCSLTTRPRCSTTWAGRRHRGAAWRPGAGLPALLARHQGPLPPGAWRPRAPGAAARSAVSGHRAVLCARQRHAQLAIRPGHRQTWPTTLHFQKLGELSVVRGAEDPLARLKEHMRNTQHRVLLLAESDGRRESLLDFVRASQLSPPAFDSLEEFGQRRKAGHGHRGADTGFSWLEPGIDFVTETELFAAGPTTRRRKQAGAGQRRRGADQGPERAQRGRPGGAQRARHRPLQGPGQHGPGPRTPTERRPGVPCTWNTPTRPRCMCR
jgi:hypothetical protein